MHTYFILPPCVIAGFFIALPVFAQVYTPSNPYSYYSDVHTTYEYYPPSPPSFPSEPYPYYPTYPTYPSTPPPSIPVAPYPVSGYIQIVTLQENNATVYINIGDQVRFQLGGGTTWSIQSYNAGILRKVDSGNGIDNQGSFQALQSGSTDLVLIGRPFCYPGTPSCTGAMTLYTLHVSVR